MQCQRWLHASPGVSLIPGKNTVHSFTKSACQAKRPIKGSIKSQGRLSARCSFLHKSLCLSAEEHGHMYVRWQCGRRKEGQVGGRRVYLSLGWTLMGRMLRAVVRGARLWKEAGAALVSTSRAGKWEGHPFSSRLLFQKPHATWEGAPFESQSCAWYLLFL